MARSLHTQKLSARAERRLSRPFSKRSLEGDAISGRGAPEVGVPAHRLRPLIEEQKAIPGYILPVTKRDVRNFLLQIGIEQRYGLRVIRIMAQPQMTATGFVLGEYLLPGEIRLYAVPDLPWDLPFLISSAEEIELTKFGAIVLREAASGRTIVDWPGQTLRDYTLRHVLAHEIGHHRLQHNRGRMRTTVSRRRDHEARANLHSRRVTIEAQRRQS